MGKCADVQMFKVEPYKHAWVGTNSAELSMCQ